MTWNPSLKDVEQPKPTGNLLFKAMEILDIPLEQRTDNLKDDFGIFAYRLPNFVLVAKAYIYGNLVSCHMRAIISAMNMNIPLVMYIAYSGRFYQFNAKEVFKNSEENEKGGMKMLNFNIRLGKAFSLSYDTSKKCPLCRSNLIKLDDYVGKTKVDFVCDNEYGSIHYYSKDFLESKGVKND